MELISLLEEKREEIINDAYASIEPVKLQGYTKVGEERTKNKLCSCYDVMTECVKENTLIPMLNHTEKMANDRFNAGYDLHEVQTAINSIEEALWKQIFANTTPEKLAESLGLVATVLGAGKDHLARTYVELASKTKVTTLNLQEIFNQ